MCVGCTSRDADPCTARGGAAPAGAPPPGAATLERWWSRSGGAASTRDRTEDTDLLLARLAGRPCPPKLRHVPLKLRDRVADVLAALLEVAVTATEAAADTQTQLRAHRLLWLAPAMLLAAPKRHRNQDEEPAQDAAGPAAEASATAELRRRLRMAYEAIPFVQAVGSASRDSLFSWISFSTAVTALVIVFVAFVIVILLAD